MPSGIRNQAFENTFVDKNAGAKISCSIDLPKDGNVLTDGRNTSFGVASSSSFELNF